MIPTHLPRQSDFSAGELVSYAKRADGEAVVRSGARKLSDWRILTKGFEQRPARRLVYLDPGRSDDIRMTAAATYTFCFGAGTLRIRNSITGAIVAAQGGFPWAVATVDQINWTRYLNEVTICFPGMRQLLARFDGVSAWTFHHWTPTTTTGGQKRVPFYRLSPAGVTMLPSARTGSVTLEFSSGMNLTASHIGTVMRFINRQVLITAVTDADTATATVKEPLPGSQVLTFTTDPRTVFALGEQVEGSVTGSVGYITALTATLMTVQLLTTRAPAAQDQNTGSVGFLTTDTVAGPGGGLVPSAVAAVGNPVAVPLWDDEVMNDYRGWPRSVFSDQNRLGFCDFPALPEGIAWSRIADGTDFYVGANPDDAMFELAPKKARVFHVMAGADEFVLTDVGTYYIPISEGNPLRPGSVSFREIANEPASAVRPVATPEGVVFASIDPERATAGHRPTQLVAIVPTGQTSKPYLTRNVSELHSHLFTGIKAIAAQAGGGQFQERYVYALNADGTLAVGRYQPDKQWVGWLPWNAAIDGVVGWISALGSAVLTVTDYTLAGTARSYVERLDTGYYLDGSVLYNAIPAALNTGTDADILMFPAEGTLIGNMTANGGLAATIDGTTSKAAAACATRNSTSGFTGKSFATGKAIAKVEIWPSSNSGFAAGETGNITVQLRGHTSAPVNGDEGTQLRSTAMADTTAGPVTITSENTTIEFPYIWVRITNDTATNVYLAQARFYSPGLIRSATPAGGNGPLWFMAGASVGDIDLMDGVMPRGSRAVDSTGLIIPSEGDDLTSATLSLGFTFVPVFEPFLPHMREGQSVKQTHRRRRIPRGSVTVENSTGFVLINQAGRTIKRRPVWLQGEDQSIAPPLREETVLFRVLGRSYDPRIELQKDVAGPLRVVEFSAEITV